MVLIHLTGILYNTVCVRACVLSRFGHVRLCDPMDYSRPGSSVHGILQARTLEWGCLLPGDLRNPGTEPAYLMSPALAGGSLPLAPTGNP